MIKRNRLRAVDRKRPGDISGCKKVTATGLRGGDGAGARGLWRHRCARDRAYGGRIGSKAHNKTRRGSCCQIRITAEGLVCRLIKCNGLKESALDSVVAITLLKASPYEGSACAQREG